MQKIKTRSIFIIILAMLCAVAVAIGVSFALPKNENISASAKSVPVSEANAITYEVTDVKYYWASASISGQPYSAFTYSGSNLSSWMDASNIVHFTSAQGNVGKGTIVEFTANVTVPAKTKYTVDYRFSTRIGYGGVSAAGMILQMYDFGYSSRYVGSSTDITTAPTFQSTDSRVYTTTAYSIQNRNSSNNLTAQNCYSNGNVYANNTNQDIEFSQRFTVATGMGKYNGYYEGTVTPYATVSSIEEYFFDAPTDLEVTYDSNDYKNDTLSLYTDADWFDGDYMEIKFPASVTDMRDADDYTVYVGLKQDAIDAGYFWKTSPTNCETTDQTIKLTIKKKELTLSDFELDDDFKLVGSLELDDSITDNVIYGRDDGKVTFQLKYTKSGGGYTDYYNAPSVLSGGIGNYTATAEMVDTSGNYTLADCSKDFIVNKKQVTLPVLESDSSQPYDDGNDVEFVFSGVTEFVQIIAPGMTVGTVDSDGYCTLSATDVDKYPVTFKLQDVNNMEWASDGTNGSKTLAGGLEITPKTAVLSAVTDDGSWSWEKDTTKDVEITVQMVSSTELPNLSVNLTYVKSGSAPKTIAATYDAGSGKYKATIPGLKQISKDYTLTVSLADDGNYTAEPVSKTFEITGTVPPFDAEYIVWQYTVDGATIQMNDFDFDENDVVQLDYTGKEYTFSVDEVDLLTYGLKVKTGGYSGHQATNVNTSGDGTYTVTVLIVAYNEETVFEETAFTLKYKINPAEYDTDKLVWVYQYLGDTSWTKYDSDNPPEDKGLTVTLNLKYEDGGVLQELPAGLTVSKYLGNTLNERGTRTATAAFSCDTNHKLPEQMELEWEITAAVINIVWDEDAYLEDEDGVYYTPLLKDYDTYKNILQYEYVRTDTNDNYGYGFAAIKKLWEDWKTEGLTTMMPVRVTVSVIEDEEDNYVLRGTDYCDFEVGDTKTRAMLTVEATGWYSEMQLKLTLKQNVGTSSEKEVPLNFYTVVYSKDGEEIENFDVNKADAGTYEVSIVFNSPYDQQYMRVSKKTFVIEQKPIDIPKDFVITFTGYDIELKDYFDDVFKKYIADGIVKITGGANQRNAGDWTAYLELAENYKWNVSDSGSEIAPVKYALTSDEVKPVVNGNTLELPWTINRAKLVSSWNLKGKDGAKNNALAAWQDKINDGTVSVGLDYKYFDNSKTQLTEVVFKGGETLFVSAFLTGDDKDNFEFEGGIGETKQETAMQEYKVPKKGAEAALSAVKDFATKTWLGLPIWAWLLIALAVLILLIIIIAVACKHRKTKEEKAEAKARKEEERARKEEERERREEERRLQQERIQAERELAKAKQEAELEKIRAQAGMAGMASMAMQQQMPQQMPQQPQMPQQMPQIQQVQDDSAVRRLEAEVAEMRAKLASVQQQSAQLPAPQNAIQPYSQQPSMQGGALDEIKMQLAVMRAEQQANKELAAMKTELEMARFAAQQHGYYDSRQQPASGNMNAELLGDALISAFSKLMGNKPVASEQPALPSTVEENVSQPVMTQYPSDAVITTTTTVDTTKPQPRRSARDEKDDFSDVDGFYDSIDY